MDAADLPGKFRLGEWLVEPIDSRISGPQGTLVLDSAHLALLLCLVRHHGEAVPASHLRQCVWPKGGSDRALRAGIHALREALGGSSKDRRYIVSVGHGDYALIAHFELLPCEATLLPVTDDPGAPPPRPERRSLISRLQRLIAELQRRSVFKVAGTYLLGMWIVLQVAETTFEPLRLPDWWMTALTILAVVGLPIVSVLAWSYEITPGGIVLDEEAPGGVKLPRARRTIAPAMVAGVSLMAAVTGAAWWHTIETPRTLAMQPPEPGQVSVAVLPLADTSPAGGSAYLGEGLSAELSARLAQIPGLRVATRIPASEFSDPNVDVRRVAESLGVRHVLQGSVRRDGDSLGVAVQLIDAATGQQVWTGSYDHDWHDVIPIQREIARSVAEALRVTPVPETQVQAASARLPDVRAVDPYLAGLALLGQSGDMSRLREAERRFREAISIAPSFARAHAALCQVGVRLYDRTRDPDDVARAEESCQRALQLDPALVETEKALGALYLASGRPDMAESIYRVLVTRTPQDADGHIGLGRALAAKAEFDAAEASFRAAVQAEPAFWGAFSALGQFLLTRGEIAEAVEAFREVTELAPSSATAYNNLGAALQMSGDLQGAAAAYRRSLAIEPSRGAYSNLGTTHYFLHRFAEAASYYERATAIAGQDQALWGNLADALWQLTGSRDEAMGHYRRAVALGTRELETNPRDGVLLAQLGYYYGRLGEMETSRYYLEQTAAMPEDPNVKYYLAVAAADRGDLAAARRLATEAVRLGYPETLLRAEPSLNRLGLPKPDGQ